ncbi:kelch-like protein 2 [Gigantopelta aegis]|uniref:kelch-like protein 2 n=1 Tax=Gigantopelta aegis TaxID=1735272 RepID=UPI001B88980A|nr:kelch-like protein 2 [Gigantopelta aegis]XP_041374665.1 kelch-like protein 2 [Gigantopelta aegis]
MEDVQIQLLQNIHQEMTNGSFSDIQVICNDDTTTGSRLVLAALSPYFRAMFASGMTESQTGVLKLPSVSLSEYQDILKMYFFKINLINEENCMNIFDAAEMMQLDPIKNLCIIYLNQSLDLTPENCFNWWRNLKLYNFLDLSKQALSCLTDNLAHFVKTENVIHLSKGELFEIIFEDDLTCKEDDILKVAMKWIDHNNPEQEDVQSIFENVRLDIVDRQFLVNEVAFSKIVLENSAVREMIQHVLCLALSQLTYTTRFLANQPGVFVLHHTDKLLLSCFTSEEKWEDIPPAPVDPGPYYSAACLDNKIYITGGDEQRKYTLVYDTIRKMWSIGPYLNDEHWGHCSATAGSKVYVMSGWDTSTIEEKSENEEQWQVVGDLELNRAETFPVTVGEKILVMGGQIKYDFSGQIDVNVSDFIQCFNTRTRAVTKLETKLPCTSITLRGSVHLPDVYLLDYVGNVMHIHVTDRNGKIQVENKLTAKWKCFCMDFGIVHRHGNLLYFTKDGIRKFNLAEGKEGESTFPKPPRSGEVYDVLTI